MKFKILVLRLLLKILIYVTTENNYNSDRLLINEVIEEIREIEESKNE